MAQNYFFPPSGGGSSSNASVSANNTSIPGSSTLVGGKDSGGILRPLSVDTSGDLNVNIVGSSTTQAINLTQVGGSAIALGQALMAASLPVVIASNQSTLPISAASLPLPTGAATSALQTSGNNTLTTISGQLPATLGQKVSASSLGVVIASDQSAIPISFGPNTTASGSITGTQTLAISGNSLGQVGLVATGSWTGSILTEATVDGTNWASVNLVSMPSGGISTSFSAPLTAQINAAGFASVRVRASSITGSATITLLGDQSTGVVTLGNPVPQGSNNIGSINNVTGTVSLPTGASTSALQTTISGQLPASLGAKTTANSLAVNIASDQTVPVSLAGAATAANQSSEITQLTAINTNTSHLPAALGQTTMANSLPVVIASNQGSVPVSSGGNTPNGFVRNVYSTTNVTTAAYVQLFASTTNATNIMEIFDSSGQTLKIAFGGAGSEVDQFIVYPGGNGRMTVSIPVSTRISIKALSATASAGEIDVNLYT